MKEQSYKIAVLIVAAGASRRMGQPKQLLPWGKQHLLQHAIATANSVSEHVFVVLGANFDKIAPTVTKAKIVHNTNWKEGMGSSIASGVTTMVQTGLFSHVLILLGDQPLLDAPYLDKMTKKISNTSKEIIATSYGNKLGVPAIFEHYYFEQLQHLNKDFGARKLLKKYSGHSIGVAPGDKAVDIDTFEVYQKLKSKNE